MGLIQSLKTLMGHKAAYDPTKAVQGKNETVLFLINPEYGSSSVHLATIQTILEQYPRIQIHVASHPAAEARLKRLPLSVGNKEVQFHELPGRQYGTAISEGMGNFRKTADHLLHPPGRKGADHFLKCIQVTSLPWSAEEHVAIFQRMLRIIEEVDPAVVVLDLSLRPGVDATKQLNRRHAFVAPNPLSDVFFAQQPAGKMFWKYPRSDTMLLSRTPTKFI